MNQKRPHLTTDAYPNLDNLTKLRYPLLAMPKYDGVRALIQDGPGGPQLLSRSLKPIPNQTLATTLPKILPVGADGELIAIDARGKELPFRHTSSLVMTKEHPIHHYDDLSHCEVGRVAYVWFDYEDPSKPGRGYQARLQALHSHQTLPCPIAIYKVSAILVETPQELLDAHNRYVDLGFEGTIARDPKTPYKHGRSTRREQGLLRIKPIHTAEATIIALTQRHTNQNPKTTNELGLTKRSTHKANKIPTGQLGAFVVRGTHPTTSQPVEFRIGTGEGLTEELRTRIWENPEDYVDRLISYSHKGFGTKDKPREPIFRGFRDYRDLSE